MGRGDRRKCTCCRKLFRPDLRNRRHQRYCSADGSTVYVLIRRLNSSCSRSIAFVVRALFHSRTFTVSDTFGLAVTDANCDAIT